SALAHRARAYPAQHPPGTPRAGDLVDRRRHHRRGGAVVPRAGPAAAGPVMGQHAQCRPTVSRQRALDGDLAGACHFRDRAVFQPARGRAARCTRPARAVITHGLGKRAMTATNGKAILDWLANQRPAMLALLEELVNTDSGSYDKPGVDAVGERIRG